MTNENTTARDTDFDEGFRAGSDEATNDHWTLDLARRYFEVVGAPINEYDAGHQAGIRAALGMTEASP